MSARDSNAKTTRAHTLPWRWAQAFFSHQLRIRRSERGISLALEAPLSSHPETPPSTPSVEALMRTELHALLDGAPDSRKVFKHLATVAHCLHTKDPAGLFLFEMSAEPLRTALRQLDGLAPSPLTPGLGELRHRMADALNAQASRDPENDLRQPISSFFVDHKLEVEEARASDFEQVMLEFKKR